MNMPAAQSFFEHGEAWAKESGMCESDQVSRRSATNGSVGMMSGRWADVEFPQSGFWSAVALQEDSIVMTDGDSGSGECNMAPHIT